MRKDVEGEIEKQKGGHPKLLAYQEKRSCVSLVLLLKVDLEMHLGQENKFDLK